MRIAVKGATQSQVPVVLILLGLVLSFFARQSQSVALWVPSFHGFAKVSSAQTGQPGWEVNIDPRGWEHALKLVQPLVETRTIKVGERSVEGQVTFATSAESPQDNSASTTNDSGVPFQGGPRVSYRHSSDDFSAQGNLYQVNGRIFTLSGPISVKLPGQLFRPQKAGVGLDILNAIPEDCERVLMVDTSAVALPPNLKKRLRDELRRWKFEPFLDAGLALGSPFCYAERKRQKLLVFRVLSADRIQALIQKRFPPSIITTTARWAAGSRIVGLPGGTRPAWYFRGDYLVASPTDGLDVLSSALEARFTGKQTAQEDTPLLSEYRRLAETQKGWHLSAIERGRGKLIHWAVLLRWPTPDSPAAFGFLIVQIQQNPVDQ